MMETQLVMMDEVLIEIVLKRVMYVEEDHQLHQTHDITVHQATTKTMHLIQNTVSIDVEIVKKCLKKHETMVTQKMEMDVVVTEHQLKKTGCVEVEQPHQQMYDTIAHQAIIKTAQTTQNIACTDEGID